MNNVNNEEIQRVKEHISEVFPHTNRIDVRVDEIPKKGFRSLIKVTAPKKRNIIALKVDKSIKKSLEKSHQAVVKQLHKAKQRVLKKNKRKRINDVIDLLA
jgi:hypothetical protein